jgi:hypothetical protein
MAIGTNTFTTYSAAVNREDLVDLVQIISPVETWVTSNTGNVDAGARYHEWPLKELASPGANAHLEAEVVTAGAVSAATRLGNYTQIVQKAFSVSRTQDQIRAAGGLNQTSHEKAEKMRELANDIEYALVINSASVSGGTATARQMCGILGFVSTNVTTAATSVTASGVNETDFTACLALMWAQGGKPSDVLVGSFQKRSISKFTGNNTRFMPIEGQKLNAAVFVYMSDFGNLNVHLHYVMQAGAKDTTLILGDMKLWRKAWLRRPKWEQIASTGFFDIWGVEAELCLESLQSKGSGKLTGYATA